MRDAFYPIYRKTVRLLGRIGLARLGSLRALQRRIRSRIAPEAVPVQGHLMVLDPIDTLEVRTHEVYEPLETHVVASHVGPGDVALDLGAHIGYYTLLMARLVGPTGHVFAFEPDPDNFALLERNVALNGYSTVTCVNAAVADREGRVTLYRSTTNPGDHRIYSSEEDRDTVDVRCLRLDDHLRSRAPRVDFVKMDIQGAEPAALRGFEETLGANPRMRVVAEFWPYGLRAFVADPAELIRFFEGRRFAVYNLDEYRSRVDPVGDAEHLAARHSDEGLREADEKDYTTLLCLPPDVEIGLDGAPIAPSQTP